MKINFTSFLVTEALIYAALVDRPCRLLCTYYKGFHYHFTGTDRLNAFLQLFFFCTAADERSHSALTAIFRSR